MRRTERACSLIRALDEHRHKMRARRILQKCAIRDFFPIESLIILRRRGKHAIVLRIVSLNDHVAAKTPASRSPRRLRQQLERSFARPVVVGVKRQIRRQNADQRHIRKIMSFDDHLRSDENLGFPIGKRTQNLLVTVLALCGVGVHPKHPRIGERLLDLHLNLFSARPHAADHFRMALRTFRDFHSFITAVMADQLVPEVLGQRHVAMRTGHHMTAGAARNKTRITAAIQEQHRLLALL